MKTLVPTFVIVLATLSLVLAASLVASAQAPWTATCLDTGASCGIDAWDSPLSPGQTVVLDQWFGETTLTLPPVKEVVVVDGIVREVNTLGNSKIPKGGYVLASDTSWLEDNLKLGYRVELGLAGNFGEAKSARQPLTGIDMTRSTDALVIYTPKAGKQKVTGTNEWGMEAVVKNGSIVSVGGNNNFIPIDGYVISGHGSAGDWIKSQCEVGMRVEYTKGEVIVESDTETYKDAALRIIDEVEAAASTWSMSTGLPVSDSLRLRLSRAKELMKQATLDSYLKGKAIALTALPSLSLKPGPKEMRAVWMRVTESTTEDIRRTLDALCTAGINTIFPEVFYGGRTLYPSTLTEQIPEFEGIDPLAVWVKEAHTRGIAVHAWVHIFNLGEGDPGPILEAHPDWVATRRDGEWEAALEPGLYYSDPAHPEVQKFLLSLISEMTAKYPLDGIELDYIRYPVGSDTAENSSGYSDYTRKAFKEAYGVDPVEIKTTNKMWTKWNLWRQEQVTNFVKQIRTQLKTANPQIQLSAAVFGDSREARTTKMQDWALWVDDNLLDFMSPMLYSTDVLAVQTSAKKVLSRTEGKTKLVPGIAPFLGFDAPTLVSQIDELRKAGVQGVSLFAVHSLKGGQLRVLADGPFRNTP